MTTYLKFPFRIIYLTVKDDALSPTKVKHPKYLQRLKTHSIIRYSCTFFAFMKLILNCYFRPDLTP